MQIGKGPRAAASSGEGTAAQTKEAPARMTKDNSGSGNVKNEQKTSQEAIEAAASKKDNNTVLASMYITAPGKGSLMQRMASPNQQTEKKGGPGSTFGNTLLTTMAGTKGA